MVNFSNSGKFWKYTVYEHTFANIRSGKFYQNFHIFPEELHLEEFSIFGKSWKSCIFYPIASLRSCIFPVISRSKELQKIFYFPKVKELEKFGKFGKYFFLTFVKKYDIIYIENKKKIFFLKRYNRRIGA